MSVEQTPKGIGPFDIQRILSMLPHRYPFLMVDRVVTVDPGKSIYAYKNISINEPCFQGHFPEFPVFPGVLMTESLAQAGGLFVLFDREDLISGDSLFLFTSMEGVRFRRPVIPGDRLDLHCELVRHKRNLWKIKGRALVEGNLAAEAVMTAAIMPKGSL